MAATKTSRLSTRLTREMLDAATRNGHANTVRDVIWPSSRRQLQSFADGDIAAKTINADLLCHNMGMFDRAIVVALAGDGRSKVADAARVELVERSHDDFFDADLLLALPNGGPAAVLEACLTHHRGVTCNDAAKIIAYDRCAAVSTYGGWAVWPDTLETFADAGQGGLISNDVARVLLCGLSRASKLCNVLLMNTEVDANTVRAWAELVEPAEMVACGLHLSDMMIGAELVNHAIRLDPDIDLTATSLEARFARLDLAGYTWERLLDKRSVAELWVWAQHVSDTTIISETLRDAAAQAWRAGLITYIASGDAAMFIAKRCGVLGQMRTHSATSALCVTFQAETVLLFAPYADLAMGWSPAPGAAIGLAEALCRSLRTAGEMETAIAFVLDGMTVGRAIAASVLLTSD